MIFPLLLEEFSLFFLENVLDFFKCMSEQPFHVRSSFSFKFLLVESSLHVIKHEGTDISRYQVPVRPMTCKNTEDLHLAVDYHEHGILGTKVGGGWRLGALSFSAYEIYVVF